MQRKSTIKNYSRLYLNKNHPNTYVILMSDFDSYLDRLVF